MQSDLMRLTPLWKSGYYWLAVLAYFLVGMIALTVFNPTSFLQFVAIWVPCLFMCNWLTHLSGDAQREADWDLPQTPRIPVK